MKTKIITFWETLRATYWFLPTLMAVLAIGLSSFSIALDQTGGYSTLEGLAWVYAGGAEGARTLLSTVAGSMITVAGVTFSITIVALTLASSQFGPRLLDNFMRDTGNQIVLGTFIATYIYCLLILRSIRNVEENVFVPHISVTFGVLLALASLGVLIYYIHHVSASIQVEQVIAGIERDLDQAIERLFPEKKGRHPFERELREEDDLPESFEQESQSVDATQGGYIQAIDIDSLMNLASTNNLLFRLEYRPGDFVAQGSCLVRVWSQEPFDNLELAGQIQEAFIVGLRRLKTQDIEFAINQLVEIAVRALSPGINDPFTAMACIDRLGAALAHLAERDIPSAYRYDEAGHLRLVVDSVTFAGVVDAAFNQIRQYGRSSVAVTIRLLEAIAVIGEHVTNDQERSVLMRHAAMIKRGSDETVPEEQDRQDIDQQYQLAVKILEQL